MAIATSTMIGLALAAAASGASYYNTQQTAKKQDNQLARQIRQQGERQRMADTKVNELIDNTAKSTDTEAQGSALDKYMEQIKAQSGAATGGLNQVGATSDAYKQSGADAALGITDYGSHIAGLMSKIDAPAQQRQNEAVMQGRFANEIDRIKRFSSGDDFLAQLRLQGIRRNPGLDLFAGLAGGAAGAAGNWGGGAGADSPFGPYATGFRYSTKSGFPTKPTSYGVNLPDYG